MTILKLCKKCGGTEFYANGKCKACSQAAGAKYRAKNQDKIKAYCAAYRAENPEKTKAACVAYRKANPDKAKAQSAAWRASNPEKMKALVAAWALANHDRKMASNAKHRALNPDAYRIYWQNREAQKRNAGGVLSKGLESKLLKLQKGKCACCGLPLGDNYHLDHIMPIALGGANTDSNIQLLRQRCNNQKHAKHPVDFMQERGFLL